MLISIHALREEGDLQPDGGRLPAEIFLSTPSARRATGHNTCSSRCSSNFYPRPPRGGRPAYGASLAAYGEFLSTPSARRATRPPFLCRFSSTDFYPRPPRGGRLEIFIHLANRYRDFYPRPPRGGRRHHLRLGQLRQRAFLSTPSARRATPSSSAGATTATGISIHALREEGDRPFGTSTLVVNAISIHALREEGDFRTRQTRWAMC